MALSRKSRDLSDIQLQGVVTQTLRNVRNAYWDLAYAIDNLKAQQESLALSQQSLKDNQKRVEIGTMAPIDIVQAQAEVATNESSVIVAEAAIKAAQDNLRALVLAPGSPDFWTVRFEPSDAPAFDARAIDLDAAVRNALDKRSDLRGAKNALEQSDINIKYYSNQIKPDVNANIGYNPVGVGGAQLSAVNIADVSAGRPVNRTVVSDVGFGSVLGDVFQSSYPTWTFGVTIGYPLGANTAHANLARVKLEYDQAKTQLKNMEMLVTQAGACRGPQREHDPAAGRIGARVARAAGEEARGGGEEARRRHVVAVLRRPGAARSVARPHGGDPGDLRLQQVAGRLRGRAAGAAQRQRRFHPGRALA